MTRLVNKILWGWLAGCLAAGVTLADLQIEVSSIKTANSFENCSGICSVTYFAQPNQKFVLVRGVLTGESPVEIDLKKVEFKIGADSFNVLARDTARGVGFTSLNYKKRAGQDLRFGIVFSLPESAEKGTLRFARQLALDITIPEPTTIENLLPAFQLDSVVEKVQPIGEIAPYVSKLSRESKNNSHTELKATIDRLGNSAELIRVDFKVTTDRDFLYLSTGGFSLQTNDGAVYKSVGTISRNDTLIAMSSFPVSKNRDGVYTSLYLVPTNIDKFNVAYYNQLIGSFSRSTERNLKTQNSH